MNWSLLLISVYSALALTGCDNPSADAKPQSGGQIKDCATSYFGCLTEPEPLTNAEQALFFAGTSNRQERFFDLISFRSDFAKLSQAHNDDDVSVSWKNTLAKQPSRPVVLFIEPNQRPISALGRFRRQVLGSFRYDFKQGEFKADERDFRVPAPFEALSQLYDKYRPALEWLKDTDAREYFDAKDVKPFHEEGLNYHGSFVFDLLASRVPSANFIFAEFPTIDNLMSCSSEDSAQSAEDVVVEKLDRLKAQYQKVLSDNGVTDIVITHAYSESMIELALKENCPALRKSAKKIVKAFTTYNNSVFSSNTVRVFQALANDSSKLKTAEDWELYCPQAANIFRISYLSSSRKDIPAYGLPLKEVNAPGDQVKNWRSGCSEVVINSGYDEVMKYGDDSEEEDGEDSGILYRAVPKFDPSRKSLAVSRIGAFNENARHTYIMANSWATPLAAALAIHIEANFRALNGRAPTLAEMKHLMIGRIFDPTLHNQFEVYYKHEGEVL